MDKGYLMFMFTAQASGFVHLPAEVPMGMEGGKTSNHNGVMNYGRYPYSRRCDPMGCWRLRWASFCVKGDQKIDGLLKMHCLANGASHWKRGLIVQGIEVRSNRQN
ncbi:hypothetical protein ACLB2K_047091 [Fragaria x ananassa]